MKSRNQPQSSKTIINIDYNPQPKQLMLHTTSARQILYGGAAGGGKSHALRWDLIIWCLNIPGIETYLFRKTYKELADNHMRPIVREVPSELGEMKGDAFVFRNGSRINFCHCADSLSHLIYQGSEFHILGIDEATLLDTEQIIFLRSRVRLGSFANKIPDKYKAYLPRAIFTANPGGPSHSFFKHTFIDGRPTMKLFYDPYTKDERDPESKGWVSIFIPASMEDNKHLDAGYGSVFSAMSPERAKALRDGDWDAVAGSALFSLSRERHMVKHFKIPQHWIKFASIDWGTASPFAVCWFAVAGEDTLVKNNPHINGRNIFIPCGSLVLYALWYGCEPDKPNTGLRLDSKEVGRGIVTRERARDDIIMDYYIIDSAAMNQVDGPSIAENMQSAMEAIREENGHFRGSKKNRENNYNEVLSRLAGNPNYKEDGYTEQYPMLYIFETCQAAWTTLPSLLLDETNPERGPDDKGENHIYDAIQYACASRPYVRTKEDYINEQSTYRFRQKYNDPYAV